MTSWLEVLLAFLREFLPIRVIRDGFGGVRFVCGHAKGPYGPGFYWSLPLVWEMESYPTAEQVVNLCNVSCTTSDGQSLTLSANFNYVVTDVRLAYTMVHDVDQSMATEALKYINKLVRKVTRAYVCEQQTQLEERIQRHLQSKVTAWGIGVLDVGLTDVVATRAYRLFGDQGH